MIDHIYYYYISDMDPDGSKVPIYIHNPYIYHPINPPFIYSQARIVYFTAGNVSLIGCFSPALITSQRAHTHMVTQYRMSFEMGTRLGFYYRYVLMNVFGTYKHIGSTQITFF